MNQGLSSSPSPTPEEPNKRKPGNRIAVLVIAAALLILLTGGAYFLGSRNTAAEPSPTAIVVTRIVYQEVTQAVQPTATDSTTSTPDSSVTLSVSKRIDGYYLDVKGGTQNYDKHYGPVADGTYALGPNEKFAVYVDTRGDVYIAQFERAAFQFITKLSRDDFQALSLGARPNWVLTFFTDDNDTYFLDIEDVDAGQDVSIQLSRAFTK